MFELLAYKLPFDLKKKSVYMRLIKYTDIELDSYKELNEVSDEGKDLLS